MSSNNAALSMENIIINRVIGHGSFSTVYLGHLGGSAQQKPDLQQMSSNKEPQLACAIKVVDRFKLNRKLLSALEREIDIMSGLCEHPNIIRYLAHQKRLDNEGERLYIAMEYCDLGDLASYIKLYRHRNPLGGLAPSVIRHFLHQLSSAVEFMRSKQLIHRDLKPQNILLSSSPNTSGLPVLKLADFGFARVLHRQNMTDTLCGSPLYMAPEILRYEKYDGKADLWSIGVILFEMIVGRPPFKAPNQMALLRKIQTTALIRFPDESTAAAPMAISAGSAKENMHPKSAGITIPIMAVSARKGQNYYSPSTTKYHPSISPLSMPNRCSQSPFTSTDTEILFGSSARDNMDQHYINNSTNITDKISADLRDLTRSLLKRDPLERISFEEFFMHPATRRSDDSRHRMMEAVQQQQQQYQSFPPKSITTLLQQRPNNSSIEPNSPSSEEIISRSAGSFRNNSPSPSPSVSSLSATFRQSHQNAPFMMDEELERSPPSPSLRRRKSIAVDGCHEPNGSSFTHIKIKAPQMPFAITDFSSSPQSAPQRKPLSNNRSALQSQSQSSQSSFDLNYWSLYDLVSKGLGGSLTWIFGGAARTPERPLIKEKKPSNARSTNNNSNIRPALVEEKEEEGFVWVDSGG